MPPVSVESRERGLPWWALLLIALAIIALVSLLLALLSSSTSKVIGNPASFTPPPGPVTDLTTITGEPNKQPLVGRQVWLIDTKVREVVGDRAFWIGRSNGQQVFAVLEAEEDAGAAGLELDIGEGQTLTVTGVIEKLPSAEEAQQQWGLSEADTAELKNGEIYLSIEGVSV
jgi:hypothetical protein